jgi:hypothetical protein
VTDHRDDMPDSDHTHEDDFPLELQQDQEGLPAAGAENPLDALGLSASTEEFHFSGPAEELDFTEPADFTFPTQQAAETEVVSESTGDLAAAEQAEAGMLFGAEEAAPAASPLSEEAAVQPELAGEGIDELGVAEEPAEEEGKAKRKFELPAWVRTAEWIAIGVLAVGAPLAVIVSMIVVNDPKYVTLILNMACFVMLGLIPYALWRSSARWVTPSASAVYTVMLALSAAALIAGTWFEGLELSRYDWQFSKARVIAGKPRPGVIAPPARPAAAEKAQAAK